MNIENKMKDRQNESMWHTVCIVITAATAVIGTVVSCFLFWLRPKESQLEKRELTEFPKFEISEFLSGTYTGNIETWFADTIPFRETLLSAQWKLKTCYGIQTDVVNNVAEGDEIPDLDDLISQAEEETTVPESQEPTSAAAATDESETEEPESTETTAETTIDEAQLAEDGEGLAKMNPQEAGTVNVKSLVGYCVYGFNLTAADKYCGHVADVANALKGTSNVYQIMVPDNSEVMLDDETKAEWNLFDETKVIAYYEAKTRQATDNIIQVEITDTLKSHNSEYLYFYTDHHWTQLAAYYAYTEYCKAAGLTPNDLDKYEQIVTYNFLGSYYATNNLVQLQDNPDTVIAYVPLSTNELHFYDDELQCMRTGPIIRDMNQFGVTQKYYGFIYGDNSYSYMENPNLPDGDTCIVVKESFGNNFVPFLIDHYKKVIVIDYRTYTESLVDLAKTENAKDVIFINNLEAISDSTIMDVFGNICR